MKLIPIENNIDLAFNVDGKRYRLSGFFDTT